MIFDKESNKKEREWFIDYWAEFVKTQPDEKWSKQQKDFINSVFKSAKQWSRKEYLEFKESSKEQ